MTKQERKNLLQTLLELSEQISPDSIDRIFRYSQIFMQLSNSDDYKHCSNIMMQYNLEEQAIDAYDEWGDYVYRLNYEDEHAKKLYGIYELFKQDVLYFHDKHKESMNYFLGIPLSENDSIIDNDLPVEV